MNDRFGRKNLIRQKQRYFIPRLYFFLVVEEVTDSICTTDFQRTNVRHSYMYYVIPLLYGCILLFNTHSYVIPFVYVNTILLLIVSKRQTVYYSLTRKTIFNRRQSL